LSTASIRSRMCRPSMERAEPRSRPSSPGAKAMAGLCQRSRIGDCVWIYPNTVLTNDPHPPSNTCLAPVIEDYAVLGASSTILPGVRVGAHSLVAAGSVVTHDVPQGVVVAGVPAKVMRLTSDIMLTGTHPLVSAYPWTRHFHRGYPESLVATWIKEQES
jgi:hypothetical protein